MVTARIVVHLYLKWRVDSVDIAVNPSDIADTMKTQLFIGIEAEWAP